MRYINLRLPYLLTYIACEHWVHCVSLRCITADRLDTLCTVTVVCRCGKTLLFRSCFHLVQALAASSCLAATISSTTNATGKYCASAPAFVRLLPASCLFALIVTVSDRFDINSSTPFSWGTGIRGPMRGTATLPQGNQELLVIRDKVGRHPGELG